MSRAKGKRQNQLTASEFLSSFPERPFISEQRSEDEAQVDELWRLHIRGHVKGDPIAKTAFYERTGMNRAARRRMEARSRSIRKQLGKRVA